MDKQDKGRFSRNLLVKSGVQSLKKTLGHNFALVADREFGSKRFMTKLIKMG